MKVFLLSFTPGGEKLGNRLAEALGPDTQHTPFHALTTPLNLWVGERFCTGNGLVFIGAAGIAVRSVAPFLRGKTVDPAVVVLDEEGRFVIPLLSGHVGGANALARQIAAHTGGQAVLTTATDVKGVFAVDSWAVSQGLHIANPGRIKEVSRRLLAGESIRISSHYPVRGTAPAGVTVMDRNLDAQVLISHEVTRDKAALHLVPPVVTAGIGCRKGTSKNAILSALRQTLKTHEVHPLALGCIYSIDLKKGEPGLLEACRELGVPLETFSAEELGKLPGEFAPSAFVKEITGVDNVCERSALLGSRGGRLIAPKQIVEGVTVALALSPWEASFEEEL